jgi:hypothetical protein
MAKIPTKTKNKKIPGEQETAIVGSFATDLEVCE